MVNSPIENIFMYSWYLDSVSTKWGAIISDDYKTIFPVTYTVKLGVKQYHQAMFTRQFTILGDGFSWSDVMRTLKGQFKLVQFRSNEFLEFGENREHRIFQSLELNEDYDENYSKNAKRLIKKSKNNYTFKRINCIQELIKLVKDTVAHKIKEFTPENILKLQSLMENAVKYQKGETIAVFENDQIVGSGFFLKDKSRVTYLKGASTESAKKNGAMYGLMDFAFSHYRSDFDRFDFGGSNVESVASFYKKFGAINNSYYNYAINDLPLWFSLLKKLKK